MIDNATGIEDYDNEFSLGALKPQFESGPTTKNWQHVYRD
jgi:hypothetical protein